MHLNSRLVFEAHAKARFATHHRVLEIGPDGNPSTLATSVASPGILWHTVDLSSAVRPDALTYLAADEYRYPIEDNRYDIVVSANVVEHVRRPWVWMRVSAER